MNKKIKGSMSDEVTDQPKGKQPQRRAKVIIRKCKKTTSPNVSKILPDPKKVNGELSDEKKEDNEADLEVLKEIKSKQTDTKSATKGEKRKLEEETRNDVGEDDCIVIGDSPPRVEDKQDDGNDTKEDSSSVGFKGFKKRILAQTEKLKDMPNKVEFSSGDNQKEVKDQRKPSVKSKSVKISKIKKINTNGKKGIEYDSDENQAESQAEYAQYLGLQPTMQFKCYRCGEKGFPSMLALNVHQRNCGVAQKSNFIANLQQDTAMSSSDPNMLTNFRITRKVYLCSACGTYYENYNLFLHMREVHKKHICLYCLTMFGVADKLADHLKSVHNVLESTFKSSEEFQNAYKGSCYLICCTCENMFDERENYFHHQCVKRNPPEKCNQCGVIFIGVRDPNHQCTRSDPTAKCTLCGVKCGHYYTCPNSNRTVPVTASQAVCSVKGQATLSQVRPTTKPSKPVIKNKTLWVTKNTSSDNDDDYDISHAASFCHVDIADESGEKNKKETESNPIDITDSNETPKIDSPSTEEPKSTEITDENEEEKLKENNCGSSSEVSCETSEVPKDQGSTSIDTFPEESKKEDERLKSGKDSGEKEKVENLEAGEIQNINNENKTTVNETIVDGNKNTENKDSTEEDIQTDKNESLTSDTNDQPNEYSSQKDNSPPEEAQTKEGENSKSDAEASREPSQLNNSDNASSDSDEDSVNHHNASNDESESSSTESSDEDSKKTDSKQSVEKKDDTLSDSDDSDKPGLIMDEKSKSCSNDHVDNNKCKADENISGNDAMEENKILTLHEETSKSVCLEDAEATEKQVENGRTVHELIESTPKEFVNPEDEHDGILLAGEDVPAMALTLEDKLEETSPQSVVKECVRTSCLNCVYCSHAIKIAVNGKQLALHLLAEHRYKPVKNNETSQDVINKLKTSLIDLENTFFNTDSYDSSDKTINTSYDYTYECFQCRFVTKVHKELYFHKRKMHQKTVLLCVMCKSNFYSYSELLCHMCPGIYVSEDINFRCCFCSLDMIPSAFRLMVHLRKSHHTCDICLEAAGDQQKLSTHMWKHKLNHLCYRCGIAYRNKPDITKHLFWKHGTESVLCKKCLQKKWPHVYHFCIPPTVFICEECNASFTKAVALKVHKRFHGGELPYNCSKCELKFVSKKLLAKHEDIHNQPPLIEAVGTDECSTVKLNKSDDLVNVESFEESSVNTSLKGNTSKDAIKDKEENKDDLVDSKSKKKKKKDKSKKGNPVLDVYDLPPLNLSSESDSSDDESKPLTREPAEKEIDANNLKPQENSDEVVNNNLTNADPPEENQTPVPIVDGVWDNFHSYKAELEKRESKDLSLPNILPSTSSEEAQIQPEKATEEQQPPSNWFLLDHSYCLIPGKTKLGEEDEPTISEHTPADEPPIAAAAASEEVPAPRGHSSSIDHAYATLNNTNVDNTIAGPVVPEQLTLEEPPSTPPPQAENLLETHSDIKKKQKTPKKKKLNMNSSSSSDSSSDSDSSGCTCRTNCSCSSSSSSSSTSSSSDSDSSTSEGRRKAAAKKEKKKEKLKHKHHKEEESIPLKEEPPSLPLEEEPIVDAPLEPIEVPIRESDLDTDESSTDEDFYDKCPQSHAKQQIEKRNKLMLLASVAPVNNGTVSPPPAPPVEDPSPPPPSVKRKIKTKRKRKSQQNKKTSKASLLQTQPSTSMNLPTATSTPSQTNHQNLTLRVSSPLRTPISNLHSDTAAGSGSENESARLSKRKRVRNKFYGYSSDEEEQEKQGQKWRKVDSVSSSQPMTQGQSFQPPLTTHRLHTGIEQLKRPKSESSGSDDDELHIKKMESSNSSSSSSDSEHEMSSKDNVQKEQTEKSDNLYCYCQCPYDEVSEMIACDGQDCTIEWFHFECVGIMVPPKGKWYCPDCRKRRDLM